MVEFDTDDLEGYGVIATRTWTVYEKIATHSTKKTAQDAQSNSGTHALSVLDSSDTSLSKKYGLIENHFKIKEEIKMN